MPAKVTSESMVLADGRTLSRHLVVETPPFTAADEWSVPLDGWAARVYLAAEAVGAGATLAPALSTRPAGAGTAGEVGTKGRSAVIVPVEPPMVFVAPPPGAARLYGRSNVNGAATEVRTTVLVVGL